MLITLDGVLLISALGIFLWSFERYRRRFVKSDLLIGTGLATGLISVAILPGLFDQIGRFIELENRFLVVSLLANLTLLVLILYYIGQVRGVHEDVSELTRTLSVEQAPSTNGGTESIYIVIPAYNEAKTIRTVVEASPDQIRGHAVQPVVVSDGSGDDTAEQAAYNGTIVVEHAVNQGQGGALKTGFEVAQQNDAAIVVTMDGDGQHAVEELDKLVDPVIDDHADFVMGSRYLGDDDSGNGPVRRAGIRTFTGIINVLTKSDITDCTNGFRAIRGSEMEDLKLTEERFNAPELIIEARKNGLRIKELPITIEERQAGETKKPRLGYAFGLTRTILTTWIR